MADRRVLIVTGASSGIGRELALTAARRNFAVIAVARRRERLETLAHEIADDGGACVPVVLDVTAADAAKRIAAAALTRFGRIDAIVNNAGYASAGALLEQSEATINAQWQLHVMAPLRLTREALPALRTSGGSVLLVGSGLARVPAPYYGAYCAAKAAVRAAAAQLRRELRGSGVAVTYFDPGVVPTEFSSVSGTPSNAPRWLLGSAPAVAARMLYAIEKRPATMHAVPWQSAPLALLELFPRLADRAFAAPQATSAPDEATPLPDASPPGASPPAQRPDFEHALEPVARRMERVNLPASFLAQLLVPGEHVQLSDAAMQWAGMPNKNERAALREALDALTAGGFLEREGEERWRVLRAAD